MSSPIAIFAEPQTVEVPSTQTKLNSRVAVVMTVYNGLPFIRAAVDSVISQTFKDFQFIIVDDGSTDGTSEFLRSIQDPRLVVLHQVRSGQHAAAHRAIEMTTADYIARMDSDDISDSTRLEKQVRFLDTHPDVGLLGSQITRRGENGSGLLSHLPTDHERIVDDLLHNRHSMCNPATMFRRHLYFAVGGYWEHNIAEDWDLFLKIADHAKLANLDEPLLSYRFHASSINGKRIVDAQLYNEYAACLARLRRDGLPQISYNDFYAKHRIRRFPHSILFRLDCYSIAQYRQGVAEIHSNRPFVGAMRTVFSILCSPRRTLRRVKSYLASKSPSKS